MTEQEIQQAIYTGPYAGGHKYYIPNVYLYSWESDMISVTKAGYVYESEIKTSVSDFKKDFEKLIKHYIFVTNEQFMGFPNYFYYVCPEGLLKLEDIPEYAGLKEAYEYMGKFSKRGCEYNKLVRTTKLIRKAPLLHKNKITEAQKLKLLESMYYRYWGKFK